MQIYRSYFSKFPYPPQYFVGRNDNITELMKQIDFTNKTYRIICIVGSPGIGKSALAITVGNEMILNGAVVHYVDMAEFPEGQLKQVLAEKILPSENMNITFDRLLTWAGTRFWYNLIVLDNCDECVNIQKQEFQNALHDILHFSKNVKILTTSREETLHLESYYVHKLAPLSRKSACKLLEQKIPLILNETEK